jgi:hypothetical protein
MLVLVILARWTFANIYCFLLAVIYTYSEEHAAVLLYADLHRFPVPVSALPLPAVSSINRR